MKRINNFSSQSKPPTDNNIVLDILNIFSSVFENHRMVPSKLDFKLKVLIWYNGTDFGLTSFRSDFIYYSEADIPIKDFTNIDRVIGIGTAIHEFVDVNDNLTCLSYNILSEIFDHFHCRLAIICMVYILRSMATTS